MSVLADIIAGILKALPGKAPYCIWTYKDKIWWNQNEAGNSARRCKKARAVFLALDLGLDPKDIVILPKGIKPPNRQGG